MEKIIFGVLLYLVILKRSNALECYVCQDQEKNDGKCLKTIAACEQGQDVCLSEVRYGSQPYWTQGALKQFYISKRCSTKRECERIRSSNMKFCTHIWYEDWKCTECCQGERCNYYIISDATKNSIHISVLAASYFLVNKFKSIL